MAHYRYEIKPGLRGVLTNGWLLRIWRREPDGTEIEIGSGAFVHGSGKTDNAYAEALQFADQWLRAHGKTVPRGCAAPKH
jgi:hypothetical protein